MNERSNSARAHPQDGRSSTPARRSIAATLFAILVFLTQVGPALACDVFDGPGGPGCPALFHSDPVPALGDRDHRTPDDCANGPSYLVLEVLPLQLHPQVSGGGDALTHGWATVAAHGLLASRTHLADINALRLPIPGGDAQQRYAYLHTLRLRI